MTLNGPSAASNSPIGRLLEVLRMGSGRRIATIACLTGLAGAALIGTLHPLTAAGVGQPAATDALAATTGVGGALSNGDPLGGVNWIDLITKGTIVLALLFITLRVLSKVGPGTAKKDGRLTVLESRTLAPKASLHLVAIGDRRLVVGLTPSGMVSLAELDASEIETEGAEAAAADAVAADEVEPGSAGRSGQPTIASTLDSLFRPLDALTGRLALFLTGGRTR